MEYKEAIDEINSLLKFGMQPGLERISKLLSLMGNPQDKLKFIHVAGTNGKGSTCTMLSYILTESSYKTGLFTSPYVNDFRERIQINNKMIPKDDLERLTAYVFKYVKAMAKNNEIITEFEFITALAFMWFYENNCDIIVLETGLGGRYDATNVIKNPLVSIITSISLDHTKILGDTLEKIAFEKAGIIKQNGNTVLYHEQSGEVIELISSVCRERNNELTIADDSSISVINKGIDGTSLLYNNDEYLLPLIGEHQVKNLAVVFSAVKLLRSKGIKIQTCDMKYGLAKAKIPARIEILSKNPLVIIDGSHNEGSLKALYSFILNNLADKEIVLLIGVLKDKNIKILLNNIVPLATQVITFTPQNPRAMQADELNKLCKKHCKFSHVYNNKMSCLFKDKNKTYIIAGSLYLCSDVRKKFLEELN